MTTVQLTGPQLEVIALLAEGLDVNEIAAKTGGTQQTVNRDIWAACIALDAHDRTHLIAVAYRAGLLHIPAVTELRGRLATARAEAEQHHTALTQANDTAARLTRQRDHARRLAAHADARLKDAQARLVAVDPAEVEQLRAELAKAQQAAAAATAAPAPADTAVDPDELARTRNDIERLKRQARAAGERADRAEQQLAMERLANTPAPARGPGKTTGPYADAIAHLERLGAQARDAAQRGGIAMVHTAKGVDLAVACLRKAAGP